MHPREMSNRALVAASAARHEGFGETENALIALAAACEDEARWADQPDEVLQSEQLIRRPLSEQDLVLLFH